MFMSERYIAAIATARDVVAGDEYDVSVIVAERHTVVVGDEERTDYELTDRLAMDPVEVGVPLDDDADRAIAAAERILAERGWTRVGGWEVADNALYAQVERS